ncbi:MAG: ABC transporter substrate-binding protein [Lachnospiraceae bacterium]|nr:ABC transporter substrate-binding protein [Lachnospiraceae bacterium]
MKKRVISVLLVLAMVLGMGGCSSAEPETPPAENGEAAGENQDGQRSEFEVLNVGTMPLTVGIPVIYAQEQGYFEEAGLNVKVELFATGAPINEAIAAKQIDIAVSGFASVYSLANADCTWLADVNTVGGMGLYVRPDSSYSQGEEKDGMLLGNPETLKGIQVLEPLGTSVQYMTESYAEKCGLTPADINQVNMEYASAYQAFTTGEGDAMAANAPYSYFLEDEGYVRLCTFKEATGVNMCDGCFARNEIVENRAEEVQLFVECLIRAVDELCDVELRTEYTKKVYEENAISYTDSGLAHEMEDITYVGTETMKQEGYRLGAAWVAITDFLVQAEKITSDNAPNVEKSINPEFVSKAIGVDVKAD